jgi:Dyp-type peroxidase family
MHQADRRRRLSDDAARGTVIADGPRWWGGTPDEGQPSEQTPAVVHCMLILYALDDAALDVQLAPVEAVLASEEITVSCRRRLSLRADAEGISREHFGFADGISQPVPCGDAIIPSTAADVDAQLHWHGVAAGEILFGHFNAHKERAPGPIVDVRSENSTANAALSADGAPAGFLNLGLNGSYLVVRELRQDVAAFWNSMDAAAGKIGQRGIDGTWLAERVIGRTLNGATLTPGGTSPTQEGLQDNNFGFSRTDVFGFGCPLGAHIRRANPRDSLPSRDGAKPNVTGADALLTAVNAHRILRRGRKYGPEITDLRLDDGEERGLLFMCLNSDLARHFEFVQQTWLLNQGFATLSGETDPMLGPKGRMTIPALPLRERPEIATFVQLVGGEYFFLPSLPALDYLAGLKPAAPTPESSVDPGPCGCGPTARSKSSSTSSAF